MLTRLRLDQLTITDEHSFDGIACYARLKAALLEDGAEYLVMPEGPFSRWDHTLLLNLTFWQPGQQDDVLEDASVPADVVAHRAWHHVAHRELGEAGATAAGLLFGEAIASAFDVYLIGQLLTLAPDARMLETQVPAMAEVAAQAGLSEGAIDALLQRIARAPAVAFEQLRELLFDVGGGLRRAAGATQAAEVLEAYEGHPFAPILHHYELSNWTLYARAFASEQESEHVTELDRQLRGAPDALAWLEEHWLASRV